MSHTASPSLQREVTTRSSAYRRARLALAVLLGMTGCASDAGDPTPLRLIFDTPVEMPAPLPIQMMHAEAEIPAPATLTVSPPRTDLSRIDEVYWTAREARSAGQLASDWGLKTNTLLTLNPDVVDDPLEKLPEGTKLLVYRYDPEHPPQSVGSPNRGKLRNGMPLPEGDAWRLRP